MEWLCLWAGPKAAAGTCLDGCLVLTGEYELSSCLRNTALAALSWLGFCLFDWLFGFFCYQLDTS